MGKSVEEWEMYFAQLSPEFLEEVIAAIETLQKAEMFFEEYEWTHLFTLVKIAKRVAEDRAEAAMEDFIEGRGERVI